MVTDELTHKQEQIKQERTKQRLERFQQRYGAQALQFAQYASFPLILTSELCYLLRERFTPDLPWYVATDVLLSGLCDSIGYDLYEMDSDTQNYLRCELAKDADLLDAVAQFLGDYIADRLRWDVSTRAKQFGDPAEWIAMACLRPADEVTQEIKRQLVEVLRTATDPSECFRLVAMIENIGDLLAQRGYQPVDLRELQQRLELGEPIDELDQLKQVLTQAGFPTLKPLNIEVATLTFSDTESPPDTLTLFSFETITVNQRGQEIQREPCTAYHYIETLPEGLNLDMVAIPSGRFTMGSPESEQSRYEWESPQHEVTVPPFFLGKYVITQAQWRIVAGLPQEKRSLNSDPSRFKGKDLPVETVSWQEAEEFCLRLSKATGRTYRLPSEAEWEYACRAGTQTPFHFGETITGRLANYYSKETYKQEKKAKFLGQTTPVGQFLPNRFGLYDMHGNVWEWCQDHWHSNFDGAPDDGSAWLSKNDNHSRTIRGGSWYNNPWSCRSAYRNYSTPVNRLNDIGFRVVCALPRTL